MFYDWSFSDRIKCTDKEKDKCLNTVYRLLAFSNAARKEGILSLEIYLDEPITDPEIPSAFIRKALRLIIDGTDPVNARRILELSIISSGAAGKSLLDKCLVLEGILSIQSGDNPGITEEILIAMLGEDYGDKLRKYVQEKNEKYIEKIKDDKIYSDETALLEKLLKFSDNDIRRILREIDITELARGLAGASGVTKCKIFDNIPVRVKSILIEELQSLEMISIDDIAVSQKKIINVLEKLGEFDEIDNN